MDSLTPSPPEAPTPPPAPAFPDPVPTATPAAPASPAPASNVGELAPAGNVLPKEAFEAAKELNTVEGWHAFLKVYRSGFYANLARAYLTKLENAALPLEPGAASKSAPPP